MLQSINDRIQGWLGWLIVALISVPFALWGIQSYLDVGANKFVAKVNDAEITTAQFDQALSQQRARLQQMFGKNMPSNDAYDQLLKKQVVNQLITTEALNQYANEKGYTVADASLSEAIRSIDAFKDNGQFSQKLYERVINSQGMSLAGFEAIYRQELATSHIQNAIMASAISTDTEVRREWELTNQHRNVSYVEFRVADFLNKASVSDEEAKQYYQEKSFRFMNPEQVSVQYIELKAEQLENEIPVSEADIKQRYEAYVADAKSNEQRKARHILVALASDASGEDQKKALAKINNIKDDLNAGKSFSELAEKNSDDQGSAVNGGDLGLVSKGMMVKPFEDSLFVLNEGQVSDVVRSEFGYHIIKLDSIQTPEIDTLAVKKVSIEKELKESGVQNLFYERAEIMANLAYENPESLDLVAEQLKLDIKTSSLFTRSAGTGIAANEKVRNTAFQETILKENLNSDAVEISNKHVVVIRVKDHKPSTAKAFEQVQAVIKTELKNSKARQLAAEQASALVERMKQDKSSQSWSNIAAEFKNTTKMLNLVKRDNKEADSKLIKAAFKLSKPENGSVSFTQESMNNGNPAVVVVHAVTNATGDIEKVTKADSKKLKEQIANKEFSAVVAKIKSQAEIYIPAKAAE